MTRRETESIRRMIPTVLALTLVGVIEAQLKWLTKPQSTVVTLSQDLVLDCQAVEEPSSGGRLRYTWLFNSSTVQGKTHLFANASLFVPKVTQQDVGNYTCTVTEDNEPLQNSIAAAAQVIFAFISDFVVHPQNTTVTLETDATLTCVTGRSAPYPAVSWETDGGLLQGGRTVTATYGAYDGTGLSVQVSMKLTYRMPDERARSFRCVARNELSGQTVKSQQAVVRVEVAPASPQILSVFPSELVVASGDNVTLDCKVKSYPPALIRWFRNDEPVNTSTAGGDLCDVSTCNRPLMLTGISSHHAGWYYCEASNSQGVDLSPATLLVFAYIGIDFKVQPSDTSALAGTATMLYCTPPASVPPAVVTWYKDYLPLSERGGQFAVRLTPDDVGGWNLYFPSVQESDAGLYYCVASNNYTMPASRTSSIARLAVTGSALITEPPLNTQILKGALLHLSCKADLATVNTVYWVFEGQKIVSSQTVSLLNHGQDLWISNVGKSWEGIFTCVAENSLGQKSATAKVTVVVPPVRLQDIGDRQATVGTTVLLPCYIYGDPTPSLLWFHDDKQVSGNVRTTLLPTGLYIQQVSVTDRGDYACVGKNIGGQAWSNGSLDVTVPPTILADTQNLSAVVGQSLTLTCRVDGHPWPSVHWLHNGSSFLASTFTLSSSNTSLTIPSFTWSLAGQYTCVASNPDGSTSLSFYVTPHVSPQVVDIVGSLHVAINTNINLTCIHRGVPLPEVMWFFSGKRITSSLDGRVSFPLGNMMLIMFAQKSDEGLYTCLASNVVGNSSLSVRVLVTGPPRPPELLEIRPLSVSSVLLSWSLTSQDAGTDVDAFIVRYRDRSSLDVSVYPEKISPLETQKEISGLSAGVEYVFTVSAANTAGEGTPSNPLTAITFPSGPSEPKNIKVLSTTSTTATLSWEIPAQNNGNIRIYQLQYRPYLANTDYTVVNVTSLVFPTQTVVMKFLQPYTMYLFHVRAAILWNGQLMWGTFSAEMAMQTNMTVPSASPSNITATPLDPFSVRVEWQPVPTSEQHGPITGYKLTYWLQGTSAQLGSTSVNSSQKAAIIRGLSPWTWYYLTLEAENLKGFGPKSDFFLVQTLPTAPTAPPQSVVATALPGNKLEVEWQPVPEKDQNCQIAQYLIQYRRTGETDWTNKYTSNNHTSSAQLENLVPWTWYEVQVAAFTKQVSPGVSPFSAAVEIKTLQGVASPVRNVSFHAGSTDIYLEWKIPESLNGVLVGYRVDYYLLPLTDLSEKTSEMVSTTYTELTDLLPGREYNISIRAINGAGAGIATILRIWTATQPVPTVPVFQEVQTLEVMETLMTTTAATSGSAKNLPAIVGGTLVGVAILVTICAIFLCRWCRSKTENSTKYLIQDGSTQFSGYGSGSLYRNLEDLSDTSTSHQQVTSSFTEHHRQQQPHHYHEHHHQKVQAQQANTNRHHQATNNNTIPRQLADASWLAQQANQAEDSSKGPSVYLPGAETKPVSSPASPSCKGIFTIEGMDNLAFVSDGLSLPGLPIDSPVSSPGGAGGMVAGIQTKKRGRMSTETAAAIAMLRSNTATSLMTDDMEALLSHEFNNIPAEVVFKQRTVL